MPLISVTKRFEFHAAHRLSPDFPGNCNQLHGHNYGVEITLCGEPLSLNKFGILVEFGEIKTHLKSVIDHYFDHGTFVEHEDKPLADFLRSQGNKHFVIRPGLTSSAESIAKLIFEECEAACNTLPDWKARGIRAKRVRVYETESSWAEVEA